MLPSGKLKCCCQSVSLVAPCPKVGRN
jgi:hypothetical protein